MGNCHGKQSTRHRIHHREVQIEDIENSEDDGPYMLVLNNNESQPSNSQRTNERQRWWRRTSRSHRNQPDTSTVPPTWTFCKLTEEVLDKHILETLSILRSSAENDTTLILKMKMFKSWANGEKGWNMVLHSLVRAIPLDDALGPSAITLFIDHCPLPTRQGVLNFVSELSLSRNKAEEEFIHHKNNNKNARHRNVCAVLGHLAESLAGALSKIMLTDSMLEYFITGLDTSICNTPVPSTSILYSLIAIEKLAKTGENKKRFLNTTIRDKLLVLEEWSQSGDYKKRQVGFCAQWLLDNVFLIEGRKLTYETVKLDHINSMLNSNDVSQYLKISVDGLEARSDASFFESVRCTSSIDAGCWYYEVTIITPGVMQIGWATKDSKFLSYDGYGIGDDEFSCAYDGCRQLYWHQAQSSHHCHPAWKEGDIVGLLLDLDNFEVVFSLNGDCLNPEKGLFDFARTGFFAAASFMSHQQCIFNFGATPFKYPPRDRNFSCFNEHAHLDAEDKLVLPKFKKFELALNDRTSEKTCGICCDLPSDTVLLPCMHGELCHRCAQLLDSCHFCRVPIEKRTLNAKQD